MRESESVLTITRCRVRGRAINKSEVRITLEYGTRQGLTLKKRNPTSVRKTFFLPFIYYVKNVAK